MKTRKIISSVMAVALTLSLASCTDSSKDEGLKSQYVEYDVQAAVAPYLDNLDPIPEADKDYVIEMGLNDCDHMVAAFLGRETGIYEALGLNVNVTMSSQAISAVAAGDMDMAYHSFQSYIRNYNKGGPFKCLVGSHLGGARYFVVRDEITSLDQIKKLTVSEASMLRTEWLRWCLELGMDPDVTKYEGASMSQPDSLLALKSDAIDGIFVCDPYASQAEEGGFGRIINTSWGSQNAELGLGWGQCCTEIFNSDFVEQHPELTTRVVLAHCLSTKYMYEHPYTAGLMFAESFGTTASVGLRTMYLKTNAEGRTLSWEISMENLHNLNAYETWWNIPEGSRIAITNGPEENFYDFSFLEACGIESFDTFLEEAGINERFPIGMTYTDWLAMAEAVDGVDSATSEAGKNVEKWMRNEVLDDQIVLVNSAVEIGPSA